MIMASENHQITNFKYQSILIKIHPIFNCLATSGKRLKRQPQEFEFFFFNFTLSSLKSVRILEHLMRAV